jgi:UDP-N-acetylglucosamine diphosphorylase / glucose-1-phosphate thymidylyltransferase / UDP-N-acetylgalactosamine diphosphorylase / glucosamine-1-phosphate N-acetyltransferase / galactosamine-1-phosphate N-acetyltransferase
VIQIRDFIQDFPLEVYANKKPWDLITILSQIITGLISQLGDDFSIEDGIAIHRSSIVEPGAIIKPPVIVFANSFIGAHAYLRGGVYIGDSVVIGPGCEIKSSVIGDHCHIAHFNFIGDSIIGNYVNFEAGAITANYHNDKPDKRIYSVYNSNVMDTGVEKFGSLVGDHSKIGANAVLSPGTLLPKNTIIERLQLVNQYKKV